MRHWLVKQEPDVYPFTRLIADGCTNWTGVRNYQARNSLNEMCVGDGVLYYHSVQEKAVTGVAIVSHAAFPDPTVEQEEAAGKWVAVELKADRLLPRPVPLAAIKADATLTNLLLLKQSRLSVMPVTSHEFRRIVELGES